MSTNAWANSLHCTHGALIKVNQSQKSGYFVYSGELRRGVLAIGVERYVAIRYFSHRTVPIMLQVLQHDAVLRDCEARLAAGEFDVRREGCLRGLLTVPTAQRLVATESSPRSPLWPAVTSTAKQSRA